MTLVTFHKFFRLSVLTLLHKVYTNSKLLDATITLSRVGDWCTRCEGPRIAADRALPSRRLASQGANCEILAASVACPHVVFLGFLKRKQQNTAIQDRVGPSPLLPRYWLPESQSGLLFQVSDFYTSPLSPIAMASYQSSVSLKC